MYGFVLFTSVVPFARVEVVTWCRTWNKCDVRRNKHLFTVNTTLLILMFISHINKAKYFNKSRPSSGHPVSYNWKYILREIWPVNAQLYSINFKVSATCFGGTKEPSSGCTYIRRIKRKSYNCNLRKFTNGGTVSILETQQGHHIFLKWKYYNCFKMSTKWKYINAIAIFPLFMMLDGLKITAITLNMLPYFVLALRPNAGYGRLIHEVSGSQRTTHYSR